MSNPERSHPSNENQNVHEYLDHGSFTHSFRQKIARLTGTLEDGNLRLTSEGYDWRRFQLSDYVTVALGSTVKDPDSTTMRERDFFLSRLLAVVSPEGHQNYLMVTYHVLADDRTYRQTQFVPGNTELFVGQRSDNSRSGVLEKIEMRQFLENEVPIEQAGVGASVEGSTVVAEKMLVLELLDELHQHHPVEQQIAM